MEQIQNNRVMTDLYRENAQFPGIALDGSDVYLCWQRFVDRHDSLMASCRRGDEVVWEREISDGGEVLHPVILDRKSTRLKSSHLRISYAVFCLKKKKNTGGVMEQTILNSVAIMCSSTT